MEVDVGAALPCMLVARFFHRHAHSSKLFSINTASASAIRFRHFTFQPRSALVCISARLQEDAPQNVAGIRKIKVKFVLRRKCEFGQQFFVIGDHSLLGEWNPNAAIPMEWSEGHVWTLQLDLLSGTRTEFKVLLKAGEELLEWQPGPNCKLEVLDRSTSPVIVVPWSQLEESSGKAAPGLLEMNDVQFTQDATDEIIRGGTNDSTMAISKFEVLVDERQGAMEQKDEELIGDEMYWNSEPSQEFLSLFPIPEAWYAEKPSNIPASQKSTDLPSELPDVNAAERTLTSVPELPVVEKDKAGEKFSVPSEFTNPRAKAEKLEDDTENGHEKDTHKRNPKEVQQAELMAQRKADVGLSAPESEDIHEDNGSGQESSTQQGGVASGFIEPKEVISELPMHNNEVPTIDEQSASDTDAIDILDTSDKGTLRSPAKNELPGNEFPSSQGDSTQAVETEDPEDKRRRRRGWSKLWIAIVQGRFE